MCYNNANQTTPTPFAAAGSKANPLYPSSGSTATALTPVSSGAPDTSGKLPTPSPLPQSSAGKLPASDLPLPKKENLDADAGAGAGTIYEDNPSSGSEPWRKYVVKPDSEGWVPVDNGTHYGYKDDKTPDPNSAKGIGAHTKNLQNLKSFALTSSLRESLGAKPGDSVEFVDKKGRVIEGIFHDHAPQDDKRADIYDKHGSEKAGTPFEAVKARLVKRPAKNLYANNN